MNMNSVTITKKIRLKNIEIKNLRGIKSCQINDLGQINLFIGKNNAGKSTILDALLLFSAVLFYPTSQIFGIVQRRSDRSYNPRELLYKYTQHPLSVSLTLNTEDNLVISTQEDPNNQNSFSFNLNGTFTEGKSYPILNLGPEIVNNYREMRNRSNFSLHNSPNQRKAGVLKQLGKKPPGLGPEEIVAPEEVVSFLQNITIVDPGVRSHAGELEDQFDEIKQGEKYDATFQNLKKIYDDECRSWELSRYLRVPNENRTAFTYGGGRPVYIDNIGDGMKVGFAALTLGTNKSKTALIVEEIETHQHPSALRSLVRFLVETAIKNELQLFVSTHSPDVFRYFEMYYPDTKVFLIEKNCTTDVVYASEQKNAIEVFSKVGWDLGNLLKYEKIIVVDGSEDYLIIKDIYEKLKDRSIHSDGIDLLPARGTDNLREILKAFAISNKPIALIRDLDLMKDKNSIIKQTIDWLKVLQHEGYVVEEDTNQIKVGKNGFENRWILPYSRILIAGNPQRFGEYESHSITDYMLEIVLDNPKLFSDKAMVDLSNYKLKTKKSKQELIDIFGNYNNDITAWILTKVNNDAIPKRLKEDIVDLL